MKNVYVSYVLFGVHWGICGIPLAVSHGRFWAKITFLSFRHRVSTSKEKRKKDRQSMAFFVHLDHGSTVTPIKNLEAHPINDGKEYSAVQSDEYVRGRLNNTIKK